MRNTDTILATTIIMCEQVIRASDGVSALSPPATGTSVAHCMHMQITIKQEIPIHILGFGNHPGSIRHKWPSQDRYMVIQDDISH